MGNLRDGEESHPTAGNLLISPTIKKAAINLLFK